MKNDLIMLLNTLALISVRGVDVKIMAECLQHTEELIKRCDNKTEVEEVLPCSK